jgi:hypothetical protein
MDQCYYADSLHEVSGRYNPPLNLISSGSLKDNVEQVYLLKLRGAPYSVSWLKWNLSIRVKNGYVRNLSKKLRTKKTVFFIATANIFKSWVGVEMFPINPAYKNSAFHDKCKSRLLNFNKIYMVGTRVANCYPMIISSINSELVDERELRAEGNNPYKPDCERVIRPYELVRVVRNSNCKTTSFKLLYKRYKGIGVEKKPKATVEKSIYLPNREILRQSIYTRKPLEVRNSHMSYNPHDNKWGYAKDYKTNNNHVVGCI